MPLHRTNLSLYTLSLHVGEEICDCYIDLRQKKSDRQKELFENFRFLCSCTACSNGGVSTEDSTYSNHEVNGIGMGIENEMMDNGDENENEIESESENGRKCTNKSIKLNKNATKNTTKNQSLTTSDSKIGSKEDFMSDDDVSRLSAATFEDESIDAVCGGHPDLALKGLINGIKILENEMYVHWSIRYIASAHLGVYQILNKMNDEGYCSGKKSCSGSGSGSGSYSASHSGSYSGSNNGSGIGSGSVSGASGSGSDSDIHTQMKYHLSKAHMYNVRLQGTRTPDTVRTLALMKSHNFL